MEYGPPPGYGATPPSCPGYGPPQSGEYYGSPSAEYSAAAAAAYGYGVPPGYSYPPGFDGSVYPGYGLPPSGYQAYPPECGYGAPAPGLGYGPTESRGSGDRRDRDRDRDREKHDRDRGGKNQRGGKRGGDREKGGDRGGGDDAGDHRRKGGGSKGGGKDGGKGGNKGGNRDRDRDREQQGGYGKARDDKGKGNRAVPYETQQPMNNLYIVGLPAEVDEMKMRDVFTEYGKVAQCKILPPRPGENKTVALIRFENGEEARKAKDSLNGTALPGYTETLTVRFAENKTSKEKDDTQTGSGAAQTGGVKVVGPGIDGVVNTFENIGPLKATRGHEHHKGQLYVAGLPPDTSNVHLYRLFAAFGAIGPRGVHAMMTADGKCKGIAFVNFLEEEAAQLAIATYNGAVLPDGTAMRVSMKMPKS